MRSGGKQQDRRSSLRHHVCHLVTGDGIRTTCHPMSFIYDYQVPPRGTQVNDSLLIVSFHLFHGPALSGFQRLDRIHRADHPVMTGPHIVTTRHLSKILKRTGLEMPKILTKALSHLHNPLRNQTFGSNHKYATHSPPHLQFLDRKTRLDRLPQSHLIRQ